MSGVIEFMNDLSGYEIILALAAVYFGAVLVMALVLIRSPRGIRTLRMVMETFLPAVFYREVPSRKISSLDSEVSEIRDRISVLMRQVRAMDTLERKAIEQRVEEHLAPIIRNRVRDHIESNQDLAEYFELRFDKIVRDEFYNYIERLPRSEVYQYYRDQMIEETRRRHEDALEDILEEQRRSVGKLKTVMVNLFIIANISLIMAYLSGGIRGLSAENITAISGMYVSLALFIVYIYRSSNFRSSAIMAIREDAKKFQDLIAIFNITDNLKGATEPTFEFLRLFFLNRSEREKIAKHPYEVIIKGISDSNIQLKGGKMSVGRDQK